MPSEPVYSAVKVTVVAGSIVCAAESVLSVTLTQRKFCAPCCTAVATCVPMSYLRAMTGPKLWAKSAMVATITGCPTGPQDAVPTTPTTLVGTPFSTRFCGGTIWT